MKTTTAVGLSIGLILGPVTVYAQGEHPASPSHPAAAEHPAPSGQPTAAGHSSGAGEPSSPPPLPPAPSALAPSPLPAPPAPSGPPCRLAEHSGVEDADAATAAQIVCNALARAGAPADARYRVSIGKLGSVFILSVALEGDTFGSTADMREMRLASVEDVTGAAPRIATALLHGTVIEDIEAPAPGSATPPAPPLTTASSSAKVHFALGLIGQFPPLDRSATPAAGADLELHAELSTFEIVTDVRFGGDDSSGSVGIAFIEFSMGGRYFTSEANLSPFIGGGFAWSYLEMNDNVHRDFDGNHTGLGAYAEMGLEVGRVRNTHLAFGARLDLPFYSMQNNVSEIASRSVQMGTLASQQPPLVIGTLYYAPLSLEVRVTF
jgi:hypothetical protein